MKQLNLLKNQPSAYGGELLKTRKGRARGRPLATRSSMHLVLRSSKARGDWSLRRAATRRKIEAILAKFSRKYAVQLHSFANVGNHLHLHIQLKTRHGYKPFIRAITSAIAMAVTGQNRWSLAKRRDGRRLKFWDYRPYSRVISSFKALLNLRDYIRINQLEGYGYHRQEAAYLVKGFRPIQV